MKCVVVVNVNRLTNVEMVDVNVLVILPIQIILNVVMLMKLLVVVRYVAMKPTLCVVEDFGVVVVVMVNVLIEQELGISNVVQMVVLFMITNATVT